MIYRHLAPPLGTCVPIKLLEDIMKRNVQEYGKNMSIIWCKEGNIFADIDAMKIKQGGIINIFRTFDTKNICKGKQEVYYIRVYAEGELFTYICNKNVVKGQSNIKDIKKFSINIFLKFYNEIDFDFLQVTEGVFDFDTRIVI